MSTDTTTAPATPAGTLSKFKATRLANLKAQYESDKSIASQLQAEVGKFFELAEYDAASMKARDLAAHLGRLNDTANRLAELDTN